MWVHDLGDADASCGGKAVGLARLIAAGLPVPAGFVVDDGAFRTVCGELPAGELDAIGHALAAAEARIASAELPADVERDVIERARALGDVIVRSSATIEDGAAGAAAGVFASLPAAPERVWDAIRAVWASALTPLAATYAHRRGGAIAIGVIVQARVTGERITVYTRPPGDPERAQIVVQRGDAIERRPRDSRELAVRAEAAIGAERGADVELVGAWIVQARPIVHPAPRALVAPPPSVLAPLGDGRCWTWDVAHNPDPLSVAQQGLVDRVAELGAYSLRVCAGYLYAAPRAHAPIAIDDLAARAGALEAQLAAVLDAEPAASVAAAVNRYVAFYRIWAGELAPLIAAARRAAPAAPAARPSAVEAALIAAARGERSVAEVETALAPLAPAWDVAVPTFGERPGLVRAAITRAAGLATPPRGAPDLAADLAERDDALFARAQLLVRTALLARAAERGLPDNDIFWLPLDDESPLDDARRRAAAARAAAARAATWQMPVVVGGPHVMERSPLHGVGTGPRVAGRVVRFASLASAVAVGAGDVVVTRAVTPALAVLVVGCAALVSETGGLLDHGAALARELGIPCVVGCHGAWSQLVDGTIVTVDGAAGVVSKT